MRLSQQTLWLSIGTAFIVVCSLARAWAGDGPSNDDAVKQELKQFQGTWKAVAIRNADGTQASEADLEQTRLIVEGNQFTLKSKDFTILGTFTVNISTKPRSIDAVLKSDEGKESRFFGIYQIQGDTRKSCFALPGKQRPTQFVQEGCIGFEWKRATK
jgi:uncharacterized protein (TIGR03067 family)